MMMKKWKALLIILIALLLSGCQGLVPEATLPQSTTNQPLSLTASPAPAATNNVDAPDEDGVYTSAEDVAAYLMAYGRLPRNYMTKAEARKLGWPGGDLRPYAKNRTIGGDRFGNYEGLLPEKQGRQYYECDIDTLGKASRGAKRLVYSNDGLIYYTQDHYESFEMLYGEDDHAAD